VERGGGWTGAVGRRRRTDADRVSLTIEVASDEQDRTVGWPRARQARGYGTHGTHRSGPDPEAAATQPAGYHGCR
jgi:hypothetical protein